MSMFQQLNATQALGGIQGNPKEFSKSLCRKRYLLQVSAHIEWSSWVAPDSYTGQRYEARFFFTPPGRGICLAGMWEFLPFRVLHGELSF